MVFGLRIFKRACLLIFNNIWLIFRMGGLVTFASLSTRQWYIENILGGRNPRIQSLGILSDVDTPLIFGYYVVLIVGLLAQLWVAVGWHRYVLLNEEPQLLWPQAKFQNVLSYFWLFVLLYFMFVGAIPIATYTVAIIGILFGWGLFVSILVAISTIFVLLVMYYVVLCLAVSLPATAIGRDISLYRAWHLTRNFHVQIFTIATCIFITVGAGRVVLKLLPVEYIFFAEKVFALIIAGLLLNVATILYGIIVEGREV